MGFNDKNTQFLYGNSIRDFRDQKEDYFLEYPVLYISYGQTIQEHVLIGRQTLGRKWLDYTPDIVIQNPFISKNHGCFESKGLKVSYTADDTTNGIFFKNRRIEPGERVELSDGDELIIPVENEQGYFTDIMFVVVTTRPRNQMWHALKFAYHDDLTGLLNREAFKNWYSYMKKSPLCLFMIDLDKFKDINDNFGHSYGDMALRVFAKYLKETVNDNNHVSRWGGDEFVGLLETDMNEAVIILRQLMNRLSKVKVAGKFFITLSVGVIEISYARDIYSLAQLLECVDKNLYESKNSGGNQITASFIYPES